MKVKIGKQEHSRNYTVWMNVYVWGYPTFISGAFFIALHGVH